MPMFEIIDLEEYLPQPLAHQDGEPVREVPLALVWWQGCPVPREAWFELAQPETNGWLEVA